MHSGYHSIAYLGFVFIVGLALAIAYERTGSLGLVALMQGWASDLARHSIRVNTIHPSGVATDMIINETTIGLAQAADPWLGTQQNALPIALLQPEQIANAVAWLVSEEAEFITGVAWPLDAGFGIRTY